jgi:hypothetical protein
MTEVISLPIGDIRTDGGTQIRCKISDEKIDEYALAMAEDADFPPLTVFYDGTYYWLADGFHRLGAFHVVREAMEVDSIPVPCEVREGTQRDAIIYACGANAEHGMPRNNKDKRKAVFTMLTNPLVALNGKGEPWGDRELGRKCNVDGKVVARQRAKLSAAQPQIGGKRAVTAISAPGGTSKSTLELMRCIAAATGIPITGEPVYERVKVQCHQVSRYTS